MNNKNGKPRTHTTWALAVIAIVLALKVDSETAGQLITIIIAFLVGSK